MLAEHQSLEVRDIVMDSNRHDSAISEEELKRRCVQNATCAYRASWILAEG